MSENLKRLLNLIMVWVCWATCIGTTGWVVFWNIPPSERWATFVIIISMGVAVTASLIRSRYKLADTISDVFRQGVRVGQATDALRNAQEEHKQR